MADRVDLPTGIVTFVFTDIEGSTRMLRRLGDAYSTVLDRHLELMAEGWSANGGHVIGTTGDGVFVAFQDPTAAVLACADAQRRLVAEPWPPGGEVRVRMGLHSGLAAPHAGEFRALAVHQAARVMSAAHGSQVLLSGSTAARLSALDHVALTPVGQYRVRDFERPVQLFQLSGPGLPAEFPAVRAVPADGHNLVPPPTSFLGRDDEVREIGADLEPGVLVTLAGPGGVGKTRLATEIGLRVADDWPDGVWLVDLAPIDDPALIPRPSGRQSACRAGGRTAGLRCSSTCASVRPCSSSTTASDSQATAAPRSMSCWPPARAVARWRRAGCRLACGASWSGASARWTYPRGRGGRHAATAPSVALFVDRMRAVRRDAQIDETAMATIVEICRRLDGLPLALELAAARMAVLSPAEMLRG